MRILSVIQPSELGSDFRLEEGVWKVNFPTTGGGTGNELSADANNALEVGTDGGLFLSQDLLNAYAMVQDNQSQKIHLYRFPAGTVFNPETATLVSSVSLIEMTGIFDDVAIEGDLITFTDADTGLTLTLDTANLQRVNDLVGTGTIEVMSVNGTTTLSVKIDPRPDNAIQVTEEGLLVTGGEVGDVNLQQTLAVVEGGLCHAVGNSHLVMPQIELVDVAGNAIGYLTDMARLPVSSVTADADHCTHWTPPLTSGNCRVGKVGVALVEDLPYGTNSQPDIEWEVYFNGQPTGYIATAVSAPPPMAVAAFSVTSNSIASNTRGYLEDIISSATDGMVQGAYNNELCLWNTSSAQAIIKLVPSVSLTPAQIQDMNDGTGLRIFGLNAEQANVVSQGLEFPPEVTPPELENLEDYYSVEDSSLTICLAPNASTGGGTQISCADATDRFATSGLWNKWTLKINGQQVVTAGHYSEIFAALGSAGVYAQHNGELETVFRNNSDSNIRIELIAVQENQWDQNGVELDLTTNPTLMGYDPIEPQMEAFAFNRNIIDNEPKIYRRLTVCLAPANTWMNWDYKDLDTSTAVVTLTNSINLLDANQDFSFEGDAPINVYTSTGKWGDLTWTIHAEEPTRLDVKLSVTAQNYEDEFTVDFFARKPMVITLANTHEYSRPIEVHSPFEGIKSTIASIEVIGKNGSTVISNPEDGLVIDAALGAVRIEDLENGKFTYMVQGRFVDSEISDTMMVKFVTDTDLEEVVIVDLATNSNPGFQPVSANANSKVVIGLVDNSSYTDVRDLPAIYAISPDWTNRTLERVNGVGGEMMLDFDFTTASTYKLYIHAYLNDGELAILGDCVIGVDEWGDLEAGGYTFNRETYDARFEAYEIDFTSISKNNLAYVPAESPSNLRNMTGMFAGTDLGYPEVDLSGYDVGSVYSMAGVFAHSNFNGNILGWNMRWVSVLDYAFYASQFRQDLSLWCVPNIGSEPKLFSHRAPLLSQHKPVWGTCPLTGNNNERGEVLLYNEGGYAHNYMNFGLPNDFIAEVEPRFTNEGLITEVNMYSPMRYFGARSLKDQAITRVELDDGMVLIDAQALMNNQLNSVTVPSTMKVIGTEAFAGNPMIAITLLGNAPPSLGAGALPETVTEIVMSDEAIPVYSKHKDWKQYVAKLKPFSQAVGVLYKDQNGKTGFIAGPEVPEDALQNTQFTIVSISEGVTTVGGDGLFGTRANYLKIPGSLTTIGEAGLNLNADILEFPEGFTTNEFMASSRPSASTLILPSTTTGLTGIFVGALPSVVVCKALVPPTIEVSQYTHALNKYPNSLSRAVVVPAESIAAYQADPNWNALTNNFVPLEDFTYGNVKTLERTYTYGPGNSLATYGVITGTADLADVGKTVTILYSDYVYNSSLGVNVRQNLQTLSTVVKADGSFRLETGFDYRFNTHYVTAYIGHGNEKVANW